ncbi:MAG: GerAB/ArcD/ProY family transporter [bacterium]
MAKDKQITPRQITAILASTILGAGILTLPREVAAAAGSDGHLATLLGGILATLLLLLLTRLGLRFPQQTLMEYSDLILGRFLGKILSISFIIYWLLLAAIVVRIFGEMVITAVLTRTPLEVIIGIMLLLGAQLAAQELRVFARVHEILLILTFPLLLLLFLISARNVNLLHLLPVLAFGLLPVLRGALATSLSYLGIEIITMLVPYYTEQGQALKYHLYGAAVALVVYVTIVVISLGSFGADALQYLQWPTLEQIRIATIPGVLERLESVFIGVWVVVVFTTVGSLLLMVNLSLSHLLGWQKRNRLWHYLLILPMFFLARYPQNIIAVEIYGDIIAKAGLILIAAGSGLLYLVALLRRLKGAGKENG